MKEFKSMEEFTAYLKTMMSTLKPALEQGLTVAAKMVEKEAQSEFGVYQRGNMGPFQSWDELADSTKADRVGKGFSENESLYRTGELKESVHTEVEGYKAVVGSDSDVMVWQELGTERGIPPRAVLGPAGCRKARIVVNVLGETLFQHLIGKPLIRRSYKEEEPHV